MDGFPGGYSLPFHTGGPCQYLGSEILQKISFLRSVNYNFRKIQYLGPENYSLTKMQCLCSEK